MNLGLDKFKKATPERFQPGIGLRPGGERPDLEPLVKTFYLALYQSIAAHSRLGVNVVVDATHHDHYSQPLGVLRDCARVVADLPVLFVGVRCPLDVIMQRRIATWGSSYDADGSVPPPVRRWQVAVHRSHRYDIDVDTSTGQPTGVRGAHRHAADKWPASDRLLSARATGRTWVRPLPAQGRVQKRTAQVQSA